MQTHSVQNPKSRLRAIEGVAGALLGAAVGDALGWPQERREFRLGPGSRQQISPSIEFQQWRRRSGSRYSSFEEVIAVGEYSDDTQLMLATARSLLVGNRIWSRYLGGSELPLWLSYERGGGRSVKAAARSLLMNKAPWRDSITAKRYFETGANGAAMRILPHALVPGTSMDEVLAQVMRNSTLTHGHPRAIVGSLLYAQAAKFLFEAEQTLPFGGLVEYLLDTHTQWGKMREWDANYEQWQAAARQYASYEYEDEWKKVLAEVEASLRSCDNFVRKGALTQNQIFLKSLGALDPKTNGAGTVAAIAAAYFASVYAADPITGILEAAFAYGADTDTVAAMTGGLLGALLGTSWLNASWSSLQDRDYIVRLSRRLAGNEVIEDDSHLPMRWYEADHAKLISSLQQSRDGDEIQIGPLGLARTIGHGQRKPITRNALALYWILQTRDGQTLYVTAVGKRFDGRSSTTVVTRSVEPSQATQESFPSQDDVLPQIVGSLPKGSPPSRIFHIASEIAKIVEAGASHTASTDETSDDDLVEYARLVLDQVGLSGTEEKLDAWIPFVCSLVRSLRVANSKR